MRLLAALLLIGHATGAWARSAVLVDAPVDMTRVASPPPPPPAPPPSRDDDDDHWRLEGGFGVRFGSQFLAGRDVSGTATPLHVDAGMRSSSWLLYGEYDLMSFAWPAMATAALGAAPAIEPTGLMQRLSGNARYALGHAGEKDLDSNVWAEAGIGVQHVTWDEGGTWTRPDLSFGIGASMFGRGETRHGGMSAGFRLTLARRDNAFAPPSCAGPCDTATAPSGWDRSLTFDLTLIFGR